MKEWEKLFDEKFPHTYSENYFDAPEDVGEIKSFIQSLLDEQEEGRKPTKEIREFWSDIIYKDGKIDEEQVMKELADFSYILDQLPKVYVHITGGLLSKAMYKAEDVISCADDHSNKVMDEFIDEAKAIQRKEFVESLKEYKAGCMPLDSLINKYKETE